MPLGAALRTHWTQQSLVNAIQRTTHEQLVDIHVDNPIQKAILLSQRAKNTGAHLQQRSPRSGRQMLPGITGPLAHAGSPCRE